MRLLFIILMALPLNAYCETIKATGQVCVKIIENTAYQETIVHTEEGDTLQVVF